MNEDNIGCLIYLIVAVVALLLGAWLTEAVWNSDLPMWLKFFLLK